MAEVIETEMFDMLLGEEWLIKYGLSIKYDSLKIGNANFEIPFEVNKSKLLIKDCPVVTLKEDVKIILFPRL